MSHFCYFVSTKLFLFWKRVFRTIFWTKNSSFLRNRHIPVDMVTEWDKGELSNGFLWFNLS